MGRKKTNTGFKGVTRRNSSSNSNYQATVHIKGTRVFYKGTKNIRRSCKSKTRVYSKFNINMDLLGTIACIIAIFYVVIQIRFKPYIEITEDGWFLWYNIKSKIENHVVRDYIKLF